MIRNTTDQFQRLTKNPALMSMNVSNKNACLFVKEDGKVRSVQITFYRSSLKAILALSL